MKEKKIKILRRRPPPPSEEEKRAEDNKDEVPRDGITERQRVPIIRCPEGNGFVEHNGTATGELMRYQAAATWSQK